MRTFDAEEALRLNAQPWQLALLDLNPHYVHWGPDEDSMWNNGTWTKAAEHQTWTAFGPWRLGHYNECVHFYFSVHRDTKPCSACSGRGITPDAQRVSDGFYPHIVGEANSWRYQLTPDEIQALVTDDRLSDLTRNQPEGYMPTLEEVNAWDRRGFGHDSINQYTLTKARCARLGITYECADCDGYGKLFVAPDAHVSLTLWMLHPRKGAARGVRVERVEQSELPAVFAWLRQAAQRNAERFSKIPTGTNPHSPAPRGKG